MDIHTILVPIDFSHCSRLALNTAGDWARRFAAKLHLLHVHPMVDVPLIDFSYGQDSGAGGAVCEALAGQLGDWAHSLALPPAQVQQDVVVGGPVEEIIKRTRHADVAILGTHGRSGVSRFLLGSVAERVVQGALCSVFIAKTKPAHPAADGSTR